MARGVMVPKVVVAVARELVGFIWAISRETARPGSVPKRLPRVEKSPTGAARQIDYVLKRAVVAA